MDVNWTYHNEYLSIYTNIKSCHTTEHMILYAKYTSIKKIKNCIIKFFKRMIKDFSCSFTFTIIYEVFIIMFLERNLRVSQK